MPPRSPVTADQNLNRSEPRNDLDPLRFRVIRGRKCVGIKIRLISHFVGAQHSNGQPTGGVVFKEPDAMNGATITIPEKHACPRFSRVHSCDDFIDTALSQRQYDRSMLVSRIDFEVDTSVSGGNQISRGLCRGRPGEIDCSPTQNNRMTVFWQAWKRCRSVDRNPAQAELSFDKHFIRAA